MLVPGCEALLVREGFVPGGTAVMADEARVISCYVRGMLMLVVGGNDRDEGTGRKNLTLVT